MLTITTETQGGTVHKTSFSRSVIQGGQKIKNINQKFTDTNNPSHIAAFFVKKKGKAFNAHVYD